MWSHSTSSPTTSTWVTRSRATGSIVPSGGQVKEIRAINVVIVSRNCCHVLQAPANIAGDYPGHSPLKQPRILLLEGNLSHRPHIVPGDMHVPWYNYYFKLWPVLGCLLSWRGWAGGGPIIMTLKHRTERQGACGHHPAMASVPISSAFSNLLSVKVRHTCSRSGPWWTQQMELSRSSLSYDLWRIVLQKNMQILIILQ